MGLPFCGGMGPGALGYLHTLSSSLSYPIAVGSLLLFVAIVSNLESMRPGHALSLSSNNLYTQNNQDTKK